MTSLRLCVHRSSVAGQHGPATRVELRLPSEVSCIEEAVALLTHHCLAGTTASDRMRFRVEVVLAEALANAILRGNRESPDKSVEIVVLLRPPEIRIEVTDEGEGFDPDSIPEPLDAVRIREERGRGLFLIRHLADQVTFNERGNSICAILLHR
jgi:serine/threonine-protein kinase RsbW